MSVTTNKKYLTQCFRFRTLLTNTHPLPCSHPSGLNFAQQPTNKEHCWRHTSGSCARAPPFTLQKVNYSFVQISRHYNNPRPPPLHTVPSKLVPHLFLSRYTLSFVLGVPWLGGSPCTPALPWWVTLSHGRAGLSGGTTLCFPATINN